MKKINQIIAYSLLGVVLLGLVLTAVLKKSFAPNLVVPAYANGGITIEEAGDVAKYDNLSDKDDYNAFVKDYEDSFKLTIMYSLFSGKISRSQEISSLGKDEPQITSGFVVSFVYGEGQVLKSNGKVYYESVNSNTETLYNKVFFAVEKDKGLVTQKIYFRSNDNKYFYQLTTLANFDNLYKTISEMSAFAEQE